MEKKKKRKMKVEILDNTKKKKLIAQLENQYGISKLPYLVIRTGSDKYRIYSGNLSKEELKEIGKNTRLELIGIKICKFDRENIRLNFDALNLPEIKKQITKNIIEIDNNQADKFLKGESIETTTNLKGYVVVKNKDDFIGMGKASADGKIISNYIPKERRLKR